MNDQTSEIEDLERILIDERAEPIKISYAAIRHITKNFAQVIGDGGFGVVYLMKQGGLRYGMVAVKKLYSWKDFDNKLFLGEVACLKKAKHKNIARFLAYCVNMQCEVKEVEGKLRIVEEQQRLLCFEYVPNGSLKYYLEGKPHGYEWDVRYQIITGIFQGLQHLHQKRIYHLDLKPSNVLLGAHMEPKITDFGVSRCIDDGEQSVMVTKNIFGTLGYLAPELIDKQQISAKADIFSLGIIMINILTGRSGGNIENWQENIDADCSQKKICIELAQICIDSNPHNRPTIDEIIQKLNETETMILKGPTVIREPRNDPESSLYQVVQRFQALSMQTLRENSRIDDIYLELNVLECILEGSKKPSHLSYRLLQFITENFSSERKVDTNLCTEMYKGILRSVAVQKLFTGDADDGKFHQEVNKMMMMAQHQNIVRFLGYSSYREERQFEKEGTTIVADKCERLLCFEYLSKGRLDKYISDTSCGLEWEVRYQIIKGVCEGLRYIHAKVLLHLDLKPANILLDDNMIPKITRTPYEVFLDTKSYLDGSVGYLAPEFFCGNISFKTDIYSLGVIITEILTGQKESSPTDYVSTFHVTCQDEDNRHCVLEHIYKPFLILAYTLYPVLISVDHQFPETYLLLWYQRPRFRACTRWLLAVQPPSARLFPCCTPMPGTLPSTHKFGEVSQVTDASSAAHQADAIS
ncbi:hypothetical protein HU200_061540 [Digitaria exilis]|uniref:Protein kinase domain-containing protein n=1 Tax=Digitaria exilis TaxID=1010633 RepID=A0A835A9Y7_9POAL|nr:hypothetical protein HU200_061540 [Digitaria exilis]